MCVGGGWGVGVEVVVDDVELHALGCRWVY